MFSWVWLDPATRCWYSLLVCQGLPIWPSLIFSQSPLGRSDNRTSVQTSQCTSSSIFQMIGADVKINCMFQAYSIIYIYIYVCNMTTVSSLSFSFKERHFTNRLLYLFQWWLAMWYSEHSFLFFWKYLLQDWKIAVQLETASYSQRVLGSPDEKMK